MTTENNNTITSSSSIDESDFVELLEPDYDFVYKLWTSLHAHDENLPITVEHWRKIILTAQQMKLSPDLLRDGLIKQNWLQLFAKYKRVTGYVIVEEDAWFGHWTMYVRLQSSSNDDIHHAKMELKCHKVTSDSPYYLPICVANAGAVKFGYYYILADFSVDSRLTAPPRYIACNVPWTNMWLSYGLDGQHYKPYNKVCNNCRQFLQRVCRRVGLSVRHDPVMDEKLANKLRSGCDSSQTWFEWTLSAFAGLFYSPKSQTEEEDAQGA
jgi:hypothetical protein